MIDTVTKPMSPNQKWILSSADNTISITPWQFITLFGVERVVPVRKGVITFRIKNCYYYYTIYKADLLLKINLGSVRIRFDPGDLSCVHLFSVDDDVYLETIEPSPRVARNKHRRDRESKQALARHSDAIDVLDDAVHSSLAKYAEVVNKAGETRNDVPVELIGINDPKNTQDNAELNYFLETLDTVDILQDTRKVKKRSKWNGSEEEKATESGSKYKFLN